MSASISTQTQTENTDRLLLWLVAMAIFMETLDSTIVNTALPAMARSLSESPLAMRSAVVAYSLTIAILIPASGWVADRFGTRKVFFSAILLFSLGSLCCALSQTLTELVLARVLQGVGGAILMPVGRLAILHVFPGRKFLQAISFVSVPGLIGPLIGPTLGGWLVQTASWHWIFLINLPVGIVGAIATRRSMPNIIRPDRPAFDFGGYGLLALSMASISIALDSLAGADLQRSSLSLLLFLALACLTAYWLRAAKRPNVVFSLELFKVRTFSIGLLGNMFARVGSGGMPFLIPLFLQVGLGLEPRDAGMMMVPVALAAMLAKRASAPLIYWAGYRKTLFANTLLVGLSIASFGLMTANEPLWLRIVQLFIFGTVNSLQYTAMNTITLKDLGHKLESSGNSLFSMVQMLSMSLGVATGGALLAGLHAQYANAAAIPSTLPPFHTTFFIMGLLTCTSAWIFWQLSPEAKSDAGDATGSPT